MIGTLMGAGFETTSGVLGTAILALDRFPEQRRLLARRPELWPNAVEELLRYDTPVKVVGRQATADIEIADQVIPAGAPTSSSRSWPLTAIRRSTTTRSPSASIDRIPAHCRSATAPTTASVPPWPGWRSGSDCVRCSIAIPSTRSTTTV